MWTLYTVVPWGLVSAWIKAGFGCKGLCLAEHSTCLWFLHTEEISLHKEFILITTVTGQKQQEHLSKALNRQRLLNNQKEYECRCLSYTSFSENSHALSYTFHLDFILWTNYSNLHTQMKYMIYCSVMSTVSLKDCGRMFVMCSRHCKINKEMGFKNSSTPLCVSATQTARS